MLRKMYDIVHIFVFLMKTKVKKIPDSQENSVILLHIYVSKKSLFLSSVKFHYNLGDKKIKEFHYKCDNKNGN